ncbi:lytic transglycosylase domain-containing protein, partial [Treponema sp.]|uniref:lytic transglycosylase domain-containing protein n=1 Tax=Treponema sp. TaxID=166 RepID=UPI00388EEA03
GLRKTNVLANSLAHRTTWLRSDFAFSLAYVESRFKATAVNSNTNHTIDRGLFQLNSASFPKLTEAEFFDPKVSAKYGMSHLRYCMDIAGNDITALAMYNAGTSRVKQNKTPQHTLNYVAKISSYRVHLESKFSTEVLAFYSTPAENTSLAKK